MFLYPSFAVVEYEVVIIGGSDLDARIDLIYLLKDSFQFGAIGSQPTLHCKFLQAGFTFHTYQLNRRANPLADIRTVYQLASLLRRLQPQIVHTFDTKPGVWGRLAARLANIPIVIGTLPGLGSLYVDNGIKTQLVRFVYQGLQKLASHASDLTIFQNHDDARQFVAAGIVPENKVKLILGSGVDTGRFSPSQVTQQQKDEARRALGLLPDEMVVTMISRVIRSKGVLEFMAAARRVIPQCPNTRFLLIGPDDPQSLDRLDEAEQQQLRQGVTWSGPQEDIPAVLALSDIFVLPSAYREGIPRVLLEAASMGLPIVTTDSPGCNEVVEDGLNGFLVSVRDPAALSQAIVTLVEQPQLRRQFGRISRWRAIERFDLSVVADQTRSIYLELLGRKDLMPTTAQVQ